MEVFLAANGKWIPLMEYLFKSSKGSLWPVYYMVTPHQRTRMDNLIVAGLGFGPTKPNMNLLLKPILENVSSRSQTSASGIIQTDVYLRPFILMGVFDLPVTQLTPSNLMECMAVSIAWTREKFIIGHIYIEGMGIKSK